ncbi:MAG: bifunctional diaminohydroxyphosphoribosylaminopyrimidine deaminase/5-amino-6-(5-phosphoribosylamino)uracil reductase RibD [Candidatus Cloacimonetes bacterium]|nr:bifunctional diaminohydroxyphosphoribosylaminopyrimidine deaminase/5-amino-6-(5-phosphoribosylamino)uracil reductase RibD [Candidatus Cloacimonadota bacterium]
MSAIPADPAKFMKRALKAAEKARGTCSPNPFVGAVIVKNGKVIAAGWTQECGGDHAEVQALAKAGKLARGADMYVTLEPCAHFGKTPPCTQAIIAAGIKRVFLGILDPNPLVHGKGVLHLQEAGVEVVPGVLAAEVTRQLESYLCRVHKRRPFVIWKSALSLDGKYAAQDGSSRWISGARSREQVQRLRLEADVVLTGIGTVLCDDPLLTVRLGNSLKQPLRAVLDPFLKTPPASRIARSMLEIPTAIFCARGKENSMRAKILIALGAQIHPVTAIGQILNLKEILGILYQQGHNLVLLECGSKLSSAFFAAGLVDKCYIFSGPKLLGGKKAMLTELGLPDISAALSLKDLTFKASGEDILVTAYPVYD